MTNKGWVIVWLFGLTCLAYAQQVGDVADGNRSTFVHKIGIYGQDANGLRGPKITPDVLTQAPFSTTQSCNWCHDVNVISQGTHFNVMNLSTAIERNAEPWIYADPSLGVQIPLSYHGQSHTFLPEQVGLSERAFVREFSHHLPGGGSLEINCLACHSQDHRVDLGGAGGYGDRLRRDQTSWAVTAGSGVATVSGGWGKTPLKAHYPDTIFDDHNDVFFDLTKNIPDQRCEYCHSTTQVNIHNTVPMSHDRDIHQVAGLKCVDCHRAGLDHKMSTGALTDPVDATDPDKDLLTCRGCHLGNDETRQPTAGRLGSPVPQHKGIPLSHFEKLACVTCHSGPWPQDTVGQVKTSRSHNLGTTFARKQDQALPHVYYPVYAKMQEGQIVPCKLIWPAYWGFLSDNSVTPVPVERVRIVARQIIKKRFLSEDGSWPTLTDNQVINMLKGLKSLDAKPGEPVYVCGGQIHRVGDTGQLLALEHKAAAPCLWPVGHAVRPASQALGVRSCQDCHQDNSTFFFGQVPVDSPLVSDQGRVVSMVEFQQLDPVWVHRFCRTFQLRVWFKRVLLAASSVLIAIIVCYGFRAVNGLAKALGKRNGV